MWSAFVSTRFLKKQTEINTTLAVQNYVSGNEGFKVLKVITSLGLKNTPQTYWLRWIGRWVLDYERVTLTVQAVTRPIRTVAVIHNPKERRQSCGCFHISVMTRLHTGKQ
jgi:hypothetical protein